MLSSVILQFSDPAMRRSFDRQKKKYYGRVLPIITSAVLVLFVVLEIIYRGVKHTGSLAISTSIVNGCSVVWFLLLSILNLKTRVASWLVCPSLTALSYYYVAFVDYDSSSATIFYKVIVGITMTFLYLVLLNESWLISTIVYIPFLVYFMHVTGNDMVENVQDKGEMIARCIFCCFIFAVVAYHIEKLNK